MFYHLILGFIDYLLQFIIPTPEAIPLNDLNLAAFYSECVHQRIAEYFLLEVAA